MKTTKFISLFLLCIALIMGCSKEEALVEESGEPGLKSATMAPVFIVEPTGTDDTENLKNAFTDALAAGTGAVVQLTEGEYYIDLIEIYEFHGMLKGAGKGKTTISCIGNLSVDDFINQNLKPVLLKFVGGNVCVCDLTIHTPQGPLSAGMVPWIHGQLAFCSITAQYIAENEYVKAIVDNVEFITEGYVRNGLLAESDFFSGVPGGVPLADIDITVTNSSFSEGYWWYGVLLMEMRDADMKIGRTNNGNTFNNCDLGIWHNVNVKARVEGNLFARQGGWFPLQVVNHPYPVLLQQIGQDYQSVVIIEKNTFQIANSTGAILINDNRRFYFPDEIPRLVQVKNNKIHTEGGMTAMGCLNLDGAVIRNNKFTGGAQYGVRIFPQPAANYSTEFEEIYSDNGLLLGNNFSNAAYSVTTVLLGERTSNWTIVGGNLGENVTDMGENNLISGFNNNASEVPFGQTIGDNLQEIKSPMHGLK